MTTKSGRIPCEMYDKVNFMCRKFMDRMARFELDYGFIIDAEAFKAVTAGLFEKAPVFRSAVNNHPIAPYWRVMEYHIDDAVTAQTPENLLAAKEAFFTQEIPTDGPVQLKMALFYDEGKTYVCFLWNHMCMDGGGFKSFWTDFCRNYTDYVTNGVSPVNFSDASRAHKEIYADFSPKDRAKAKRLFAAVAPKDKHTFPFTPDDGASKVVIVGKEIGSGLFIKAREACKRKGATVNDLLVAAYMDAYGKLTGMSADESLNVSCAVDLRRYLKDTKRIGYTNHVAFIHCDLPRKGASIDETLALVAAANAKSKSDPFMGLHGLPLLNFGYKTMIYAQAEPVLKAFYRNPPLAVSNVGALDPVGFSLCGNEPCGAFVAGAAKTKPCAFMTALTLKDELFISMCIRGNDEDRIILEHLFGEMEKSITALTTL